MFILCLQMHSFTLSYKNLNKQHGHPIKIFIRMFPSNSNIKTKSQDFLLPKNKII
jgi:hypothetical protein